MTADSKFVIITSIHSPSEAVKAFARWPGWQTIVVGDRKSPRDWHCEGVTYLSLEEQYDRFGALARAIPENTYARKTLGYLHAIRQGATAIFESDDDNLPYPDTAAQLDRLLTGGDRTTGERLASRSGWVNIYHHFAAPRCWPRGLPLEQVQGAARDVVSGSDVKPWGVLQFLADEDPDVDAVYRLIDGEPVHFARGRQFLLDEGTTCPMNSQATLWLPESFPLLFLPLGVPDRVTDILRGYIALACLWKTGRTLGYASPNVYQQRNAHNLLRDFKDEIPLYLNAESWRKLLGGVQGSDAAACYRSALELLASVAAVPESNLEHYRLFVEAASASTTAARKAA